MKENDKIWLWCLVIVLGAIGFYKMNAIIEWSKSFAYRNFGKQYYFVKYQFFSYPVAYSFKKDIKILTDYPIIFFWENMEKAKTNSAIAENNLGIYFEKNHQIDITNCKAFNWYKKSAEQGFPIGQYNFARMYLLGKCVPKDMVIAYTWLNLARQSGSVDAKHVGDYIKSQLTIEQAKKSTNLYQQFFALYFNNWLKSPYVPNKENSKYQFYSEVLNRNVTEQDIQDNMKAHKMTRQQVLTTWGITEIAKNP